MEEGTGERFLSNLQRLWRAPSLSLPSLITCVPPQTRGRYLGPHGDLTHLMSHRQMRTEAEDGEFDVVFQLHRKELLQQLLVLLSSGVISKPQLDTGSHQDKQPQGQPKER